jgi:nitroreductase
MTVSESIKTRQSNRAYLDKPVEKEKIEQCLEAARLAPSANNAQSWTFVVVDEMEIKNRVADDAAKMGCKFAKQAPVIIAMIAENPVFISRLGGLIRKMDFRALDFGIAAAHICLQAVELGLGTCMIESFSEKDVKKTLHIPHNKRVVLLITLGYPADRQREKKRKTFSEVVRFNLYQ